MKNKICSIGSILIGCIALNASANLLPQPQCASNGKWIAPTGWEFGLPATTDCRQYPLNNKIKVFLSYPRPPLPQGPSQILVSFELSGNSSSVMLLQKNTHYQPITNTNNAWQKTTSSNYITWLCPAGSDSTLITNCPVN